MRLSRWQLLGILASVLWLVVAPSVFHLSQEGAAIHIAGEHYQACIKQHWSTKAGVERCNNDLREALAIAHWSSWAKVALVPVALAWFVGVLLRLRRETTPARVNKPNPIDNAEDKIEPREFAAPWTVAAIAGGFKVVDANGQALAHVYGDDPRDAAAAKGLTIDEARRIAANIAKLPKLLRRGVND